MSSSRRFGSSNTAPQAYAANRNGPASVPSPKGGSSLRIAPATAFRGFLNGTKPSSSRRSLTFAKSASARYASPRTSRYPGIFLSVKPSFSEVEVRSVSGIPKHPASCFVTSSPTSPSPRDTHLAKRPSTYVTETDAPSILGSATNATEVSRRLLPVAGFRGSFSSSNHSPPSARRSLRSHKRASWLENTFVNERMGATCETRAREGRRSPAISVETFPSLSALEFEEEAGAPTRFVGLSRRLTSGCASSSASRRTRILS